ncbi:glycine-rich RNA-binding protein 4, mitochondrial-like [Spinacia oleracea]|uniref:Glycine-rich RNA-binding protein 4, mitochondrial-like n=1 Tax=Spinacia oleracea TaxID=3562 RepID=A0A9R0K416_SPIOL|nr:glycine-rich RNA-binding protein 4, mitochondrial-like [Spinacia oleracea]
MNSLKLFARRTSAAFYNPTSSFSPYYRSLSSSVSAPPNNNNKLFVAGLSWSVDERSLLDAFSNFGEVTEVRIMYDKVTGRSRGFGFVYFAKDDFAVSAKDAMDGKELLGRPMRISFAVDRVRGDPTMVSRIRDSEAAIRYKN